MPYLHIQISGAQDDNLAHRVAETGTALTSTLLGKNREHTAVVVDFIAPSRWFIAGKPLVGAPKRSYHWMVSITDETNTKREKADYLAAVHQAMDELLGGAAEHSYAHVADLRGSAYGFAGRTQEHRYQHG
ncbi:MAG: tautomerase family protein [Rhizobacter sp.]|nr:tautomerase family protein [Rhizobacter sp.]